MSMDDKLPAAARLVDSPFLPGTQLQYAWDSVSLTAILSCPRRYQLAVIEGRVPRAPQFAIALVFGILFHSALEFYHKARFEGQDHDEATHTTIARVMALPAAATLPTDGDIAEDAAAIDEDDDGIHLRNSKIRTRYYLARSIVWYLEHYGADDNCRTVALPSGAPAVEVSFRVPLPIELGTGEQVILCGHIDRTVEYNGYYYNSDFKTTKSLTRQFFSMFDLSHQMTGYHLAGSVIFDQPTKGILIDGIALQVGQVKFGRHFTNRTKGQLREYIDLLRYATFLAKHFAETIGPEGTYPLNTASCYFCDFKSICAQAPEFRQSYLDQNFDKKPGWNPLKNR